MHEAQTTPDAATGDDESSAPEGVRRPGRGRRRGARSGRRLALDLTAEQRECAEKWMVALDKKSAAPRVNKTRMANEALAADVVAAMAANPDAEINAAWVRDHVAGITSAQKAVAVMNIAIESGKVIRYEEKKKAREELAMWRELRAEMPEKSDVVDKRIDDLIESL